MDAVVSTLGGSVKDPRADGEGNINIIEAAAKKGVKKFILVTSVGCGDSKDAPGEQVGPWAASGGAWDKHAHGEVRLAPPKAWAGMHTGMQRPGGQNPRRGQSAQGGGGMGGGAACPLPLSAWQ